MNCRHVFFFFYKLKSMKYFPTPTRPSPPGCAPRLRVGGVWRLSGSVEMTPQDLQLYKPEVEIYLKNASESRLLCVIDVLDCDRNITDNNINSSCVCVNSSGDVFDIFIASKAEINDSMHSIEATVSTNDVFNSAKASSKIGNIPEIVVNIDPINFKLSVDNTISPLKSNHIVSVCSDKITALEICAPKAVRQTLTLSPCRS